jgi:hypothetical protein
VPPHLAVDTDTANEIFGDIIGQVLVADPGIKLLIVHILPEAISEWRSFMPILSANFWLTENAEVLILSF